MKVESHVKRLGLVLLLSKQSNQVNLPLLMSHPVLVLAKLHTARCKNIVVR